MAVVGICFPGRNLAQANRLERERNQEAWIRTQSDDEEHKLERMAAVRLREAPENARVAKLTVSLAFARGRWGHKAAAWRVSLGLACPATSAFLALNTTMCGARLPDVPPLVQFT